MAGKEAKIPSDYKSSKQQDILSGSFVLVLFMKPCLDYIFKIFYISLIQCIGLQWYWVLFDLAPWGGKAKAIKEPDESHVSREPCRWPAPLSTLLNLPSAVTGDAGRTANQSTGKRASTSALSHGYSISPSTRLPALLSCYNLRISSLSMQKRLSVWSKSLRWDLGRFQGCRESRRQRWQIWSGRKEPIIAWGRRTRSNSGAMRSSGENWTPNLNWWVIITVTTVLCFNLHVTKGDFFLIDDPFQYNGSESGLLSLTKFETFSFKELFKEHFLLKSSLD